MRVLAWNASGRYGEYVTGVGKHVIHMINGLSRRVNTEVSMLIPDDEWQGDESTPSGPMASVPAKRLPYNRKWIETSWRLTKRPSIENWSDGADWIYCPRELFVPVNRARLAVTVHDVYRIESKQSGLQFLRQKQSSILLSRALRRATLVLTVSEFTKGRLLDLFGVPPSKVRVVGNGVESGYFDIASEEPGHLSPYPHERYVLAMGGLTAKKGGGDVLSFARALREVAPDVTLVCVGLVEKQFASELAMASNVRVLQRGMSDTAVQRLLRGAIASVVLSKYEGFGIPVLEAMAAGVPVVAAKRTALPEVVGDAGILIDPQRPEDAALAIRDLTSNQELRARLIAKGHVRARQHTWQACIDRLAHALEEFSVHCPRAPKGSQLSG